MNLYEIASNYQALLEQINGNEQDVEIFSLLADVADKLEDKAINIASYIKNLSSEEEAISKAIENMQKRKKRLLAKIDGLTEYLKNALEHTKTKEIIKSPYFKIKIRLCPPAVSIANDATLADEYLVEKIVVTPNKILIKEHLQQGVIIDGCSLQQRTILEIK